MILAKKIDLAVKRFIGKIGRFMRKWRQLFVIICFFASSGQIFASTGSIIGVISPRLTFDGRPLLWQNLESDVADVQVQFFAGKRYNFFGLVNGEDSSRVYAGLNTAGFALVLSKFKEPISDSLYEQEALLVKQALGECGRSEDFVRLMKSATIEIGQNSSFACIDAFDSCQLFESGAERRVPFDLKESPDGFLLRANFNFNDHQAADKSYWRYHRARQLIAAEKAKRKLHHHVLIKKVARDLQSLEDDPYPWLLGGSDVARAGSVRSQYCINQYNSVSCVVIHGVRPGENPDFSTMWVILGEPVCGVAVPLWPATSRVPLECQLSKYGLTNIYQAQKRAIYERNGTQLNATAFLQLANKLHEVENKVFAETRKALSRWRQSDHHLQDMTDFQFQTAEHIYRVLK
ncbi:hypothetical protein JW998_08830 [candidate division KSB1 bacterium]|nr:hypothetical protein [candidate division KSB1 bacterium]